MANNESRGTNNAKIAKFTDLRAWRLAHDLAIEIYMVTKKFPKDEQFGLTSQIRRAAVSITSNIAEGFSRSSSEDKKHFYTIALGSLTEVQSQLLIAKDIGYIIEEKFKNLAEKSVDTHKVLNGLRMSTGRSSINA
ncbi:four helix bundle protein [Candidatus Saccharibacteria bacterium]|nr:four helix bundle protein [Candidatus Saccharibacteria bacterium]